MEYIAHSKNNKGNEHSLKQHSHEVANMVKQWSHREEFINSLNVAGLLHDLGKYQPAFQKYLEEGGRRGSVPHASWGAAFAYFLKQSEAAFAIDGHHKGLPDRSLLQDDLADFKDEDHPIHEIIEYFIKELDLNKVDLELNEPVYKDIFERETFTRLIFSSLTDADWLDTEKHFNEELFNSRPVKVFDVDLFLDKLNNVLAGKTKTGWLNELRNNVRDYANKKAHDKKGFYSMTLPTGMGKTLTSMSWALHHAKSNSMKRIIIVLPYISIIDQTAGELKKIFGDDYVLEHHSNFVEDEDANKSIADETIQNENQNIRLATENWDFPIIVTTTVQFFESLFSNKPSRCRKVHNISNAVVIFDEVQTLPKELLLPTLSMLKNIQKVMDCSFLFCTATLPAFEKRERFDGIDEIKPLVENPAEIFTKTKRVKYQPVNNYTPVSYDELFQFVIDNNDSALCVFNSKQAARDFCLNLEKADKFWWFHLSTYLIPCHRRKIISIIRECLKKQKKIIVSSTQLVEAGVDFDFPIVCREIAPLESIIQSAGRCNREGKMEYGNVYLFKTLDNKAPDKQYKSLADYALEQYRDNENKLSEHDFYKNYYQNIIDLFCNPDKKDINEARKCLSFDRVAKIYKLIDSKTIPIFVYNYNKKSRDLYRQIIHKPYLSRTDYRNMQQFSVQVYEKFFKENANKIGQEKSGFFVWHGKYDSHFGVCGESNKEIDSLIF